MAEKSIFSGNFEQNKEYIDNLLNIDKSFDVLYRVVTVGGKKACFYFIDGFCKDEVMEKILEFLYVIEPKEMPETAHEFLKEKLPYGEIDLVKTENDFLQRMLSGVPMLLVEGYTEALAMDFRTYPARSVDEPEKDKVMRGSRDGFVETVVFNTALIRRRIRSTDLVMEMHTVGKSSRTDVVIAYMGNRVEKKMLEDIRQRIDAIQIDALSMNQQSLAECLYQHKWYNPFPKFKFTERPDTTAASILEGSIAILVDNSPAAMVLPTSVFDIVEDADDYYFPPVTGTYLRLSRIIINAFAVFLTPLFLLLIMNPQWVPESLAFIQIKEPVHVPVFLQLLLLEFAIDGLKLASLNTPSMLSTPLSVVAGIVLGDYTVSSGWFNAEIMLYMAFVAVANYTQVSFELGYALKFMRLMLLCLTAAFDVWGFVGGLALVVIFIVTNRTMSGKSYIYPIIPFNARQFLRRFCRVSLPRSEEQ
ncbi:MAG: spore germination protein [Lachnospiraceae bacterium]|nr:spore germination protein [Lachnospiraceae bacterium]